MKKFIFDNEIEGVYPLTLLITGYIQSIADNLVTDDICFRVKTILIELLTNSLKHVGNNATLITVSVKNNNLFIKKQDSGHPLQIKTSAQVLKWPLQDDALMQKEIAIYGDDFGTLKARLKSSNLLEFYIKDLDAQPVNNDTIYGLNEHYGLMIITRASDAFNYEYKPRTGSNIFTSVLNLVNEPADAAFTGLSFENAS